MLIEQLASQSPYSPQDLGYEAAFLPASWAVQIPDAQATPVTGEEPEGRLLPPWPLLTLLIVLVFVLLAGLE